MSDDKHETVADIIAEMRKYASDYYQRSAEWGGDKGNPGMFYLQMAQAAKVFAERIEEAYRVETLRWVEENASLAKLIDPEKMLTGNGAKMREAVDRIKNTANSALTAITFGNDTSSYLWDIICECTAALAEPPRNCDVGAVRQQLGRFMKLCRSFPECAKCPYHRCVSLESCVIAWAQMPYEPKAEISKEGKIND